jgi:hypothetical protein
VKLPIPSRFAPDGVHIYSSNTEEVVIEWDGEGEITIERDGVEIAVVEGSPLVRFVSVRTGEYEVKLDSFTVLAFRVEDIEPFRPRGVRLYDGATELELFEFEKLPAYEIGESVVLKLPVSRLWQVGTVNGKRLNPIPEKEWRVPGWVHGLDFGAFGSLSEGTLEDYDEVAPDPLGHERGRLTHLFGMAYQHGGAAAAREISTLRTATECARWARKHRLEWLLPHLSRVIRKGERA